MTGEGGPAIMPPRLPGPDPIAARRAQDRWARLAVPPGALGELEPVAVRLAALAGRCPPPVPAAPAAIVAAADHGVTARGVSAWPTSVTAAMVRQCVGGGAAVSAIARTVGARLIVVDVGVAADLSDVPGLVHAKVRPGTRDLSVEPAMTADEMAAAVRAGGEVAGRALDEGADLLVLGEVGIGNTTAAACCIAALTGADPVAVVGPGAGLDSGGMVRKRATVDTALQRHADRVARADEDPWPVLAALGGLEHAALVGAALTAAARRVPVVLDGVNTVAVALVATAAAPKVTTALFAGHLSTEPGARVGLDRLGLMPLQQLRLRLGEGGGALLAVPLLQAAARCLTDVAELDDL